MEDNEKKETSTNGAKRKKRYVNDTIFISIFLPQPRPLHDASSAI